MSIITVSNLSKQYGTITAVDGISFDVEAGELFGFLGPNGAGKSTTIQMLCTLVRPTGGTALLNGFDIATESDAVRRSLGIIFQDPSLDVELSAWENMAFHARIYNVPKSLWQERARTLLDMVELWDRRTDQVKTFSGGMKRRLEIARGLLHEPRVLFLDEPTIGLDPQTRQHIWAYLNTLRAESNTTIFLTTHYMDEAEFCDRIAVIDHGEIVAIDTPQRLKSAVGGDVVTLETNNNALALAEIQEQLQIVPSQQNGTLRFEVEQSERFIPQLVRGLSVPIETLNVRRPSLDDVFLQLTGREMRDEEASTRDRLRTSMRGRRR